MAIKLDIVTTGVESLERAAAGYRKVKEEVIATAGGIDKLDSRQKKSIALSEKRAKSLENEARAYKKILSSMSALSRVKSPFTQITSNLQGMKGKILEVNKGLRENAKLANVQLQDKGGQGFTKDLVGAKANVELTQRLNAEIEKQARLRADLAMITKQSARSTVGILTRNLTLAEKETAAIKQQIAAVNALKQAKIAESRTRAGKDNNVYQFQTSQLSKLREQLRGLSQTKAPTAAVNKLKESLHDLNRQFAQTGKMDRKAFASITRQIKQLDTGFKQSTKGMKDWGSNAKYVMGGVARSMGAMTYSYAALAPLLAGIAVGSAVREVYKLGAAFEYTTVYVDALADSLSTIDAGGVQDTLLSMEGLRKGPIELSMGMKEFAKAGVEAATSLRQIAEMSKFATIAEIDLASATKLVIGQANAYGISFSDAANMIGASALSSATTIEELGTALSYTTELATVSGTKFDEVATAMALMANAGIRGSKAATAIRTSIIKMQAPSTALKKKLDDLGISWSAFTEDGQIKNMRTMFTELKRVTDQLKPQQRVGIFKDLFGLRAIKGGATVIKSMGKDWDDLNAKIKGSVEGVSFIEQTYNKLGDTVTAKLEKLGVAFEGSLIKAFDSEAVQGMLDNLIDVAGSDSIVKSLKSITDGVNSTGEALTALANLATSLPIDFTEAGLLGYVLYGNTPVARTLAGMKAISDLIKEIRGEVAKTDTSGAIGAVMDNIVAGGDLGALSDTLLLLEKLQLTGTKPELIGLSDKEIGEKLNIADLDAVKYKVKFELDEEGVSKKVGELGAYIEGEFKDIDIDFNPDVDVSSELQKNLKVLSDYEKELERVKAAGAVVSPEDQFNEDLAVSWNTQLEHTRELLSQIDFKDQLIGATAWDKALAKIPEQAKKIAKAYETENKGKPDYAAPVLGQIEDKLKASLLKETLHGIKVASEELDFKTMINGLNASGTSADKVRGKFEEIKRVALKFYEENKKVGVIGGKVNPTVLTHFRKLLESSGLFTKVLKKAQDEVKKLGEELQNLEFGFAADIAEAKRKLLPEGKQGAASYKYALAQVEKLEVAAAKAGSAGVEGQKRQLELLKQAYAIVKGIETTTTKGDSVRVKKAQKEMLAAKRLFLDNRNRGGDAARKKAYIKAWQDLKKAQEGGEDKSKVQQQIKDLERLQEKILGVKKEEKNAAEDQVTNIKKTQTEMEILTGMISTGLPDAYDKAAAASKTYTNIAIGDIERYKAALGGKTASVPAAASAAAPAVKAATAAITTTGLTAEQIAPPVEVEKVAGNIIATTNRAFVQIEKDGKMVFTNIADDAIAKLAKIQKDGSRVYGKSMSVTQPESGGYITDSGLVIALEATDEAAKKAHDSMRKLYDMIPEGGTSFEEFIHAYKASTEEITTLTNKATSEVAEASEKIKSTKVEIPIKPAFLDKDFEAINKEIAKSVEDVKVEIPIEPAPLNKFVDLAGEVGRTLEEAFSGTTFVKLKEEVGLLNTTIENSTLPDINDIGVEARSAGGVFDKAIGSNIETVENLTKALQDAAAAAAKIKVPTAESAARLGGRAIGGPVSGGISYWVGEKGPELFTPGATGFVTPNDRLGSSNQQMVDINLKVGDGAPVYVQGPQTSIDELNRQMDEQRRYAG